MRTLVSRATRDRCSPILGPALWRPRLGGAPRRIDSRRTASRRARERIEIAGSHSLSATTSAISRSWSRRGLPRPRRSPDRPLIAATSRLALVQDPLLVVLFERASRASRQARARGGSHAADGAMTAHAHGGVEVGGGSRDGARSVHGAPSCRPRGLRSSHRTSDGPSCAAFRQRRGSTTASPRRARDESRLVRRESQPRRRNGIEHQVEHRAADVSRGFGCVQKTGRAAHGGPLSAMSGDPAPSVKHTTDENGRFSARVVHRSPRR